MDRNERKDIIWSDACAEIPTVDLSPSFRALGRIIDIEVGQIELDELLSTQAIKDLAADTFWEYYQHTPEAIEVEKLPIERQLNRRLLNWVRNSPSWEPNRVQTIGSMAISSISAGMMAQYLVRDPDVRKALEEQQKMIEAMAEAQQKQEEAQQKQQKGDGQGAAKAQKEANDAQDKADKAGKAMTDTMNKLDKSPEGAGIRAKAIKETGEKTDEVAEGLQSWGMNAAEMQSVDVAPVMKLFNENKDMVKKITSFVGRVKGIAMGRRITKKGLTIMDGGYTQDLTNIFPSELALLRKDSNPLIRAEKIAQYANSGLPGLITGSITTTEGGLIAAIDESGSMVHRKDIVKALALGIAMAAKDQGQPFSIFTFCEYAGDVDLTEKSTVPEMIKWVESFRNGNTSFDAAISKALDILDTQENKESFDIMILTDGGSDLSSEVIARFRKYQKEYGTRLVYLAIQENSTGLDAIAAAKIYITGQNIDIDKMAQQLSDALQREDEFSFS